MLPELEEMEKELLADFFMCCIKLLLISPFFDIVAVEVAVVVLLLSIVVGVPILPMVFRDSVDSLLNIE